MVKKCVYCNVELCDGRALDVCDKCGVGIWGQKMFLAILNNMNEANERNDLCSTNMCPEERFTECGDLSANKLIKEWR